MVFVVHGVCAHMCMQKPEDNRSPFYFLRQGLSLNLESNHSAKLVVQQYTHIDTYPHAGLIDACHHPAFTEVLGSELVSSRLPCRSFAG